MTSTFSLLEDADSIIREYLTWRGFGTTLQSFATDQKEDLLLGLSSRRLAQKLSVDIENLDLDAIFAWWDEGVGPLLARVDEEVASVGRGLRDSTYRLYLVCCARQQRNDLILAFFKDHWNSRAGSSRFRDEWRKQWFALPYTVAPERDRYFAVFFSQDWKASLLVSIETFLNSVLSALQPPRLLGLSEVKDVVETLRAEIEALKSNTRKMVLESTESPRSSEAVVEVPIDDTLAPQANALHGSVSENCTVIGRRNGPILKARYSPSCSLIAVSGSDASSVIWSTNTTTAQKAPRLFCDATASCIDWFDDSLLAIGTLDHSIHLWTPAATASGTGAPKVVTLRTPPIHPWILDVAFDPSSALGSQLVASVAPASTSLAGELLVWNLTAEKIDRTLPIEPAPTRVRCIRFNHNGNLLVTGSTDGMIRIFDISRSGAIMGWPACQDGAGVAALCLSRNETSVFSLSSKGGLITEWSLHRVGEAIQKWSIHAIEEATSGPGRADISASASHIAAVMNGKSSVISLDHSSEIELPFSGVNSVDWDERTLACGREDGTLCLYKT